MLLDIPDLPDFDPDDALTLRKAVGLGLIPAPPGAALNHEQVARWHRKGVRLVRGGPKYRFPAVRGAKELHTTPAWCRLWKEFAARVQVEDARRQRLIGLR